MVLLALDTSRGATSFALSNKGQIIATRYDEASTSQAGALLPSLDALLHDAGLRIGDISLIAITTGPGGFTSVRIGVATVRGLAFACNIPCHGVPSLELMAYYMQGRIKEGAQFECIIPTGRSDHAVQDFTMKQGAAHALQPMRLRANQDMNPDVMRCSTETNHAGIIMPLKDSAVILAEYMHHHAITDYVPPSPLYIRPPDAIAAKPLLKKHKLS